MIVGRFVIFIKRTNRVDIIVLTGFWRNSMLLSLGDTLAAAGRKDEALTAYPGLLKDESAAAVLQRDAKERIEQLQQR